MWPALILAVTALVQISPLAHAAPPNVTLDYATYEGLSNKHGITSFLGMRYAAAPIGNYRFAAPQDPGVETATQQATRFGNVCIGVNQSPGTPVIGGYTYGEDCLFISVSSPTRAANSSLLPVIIWITGGGYAIESSTNFDFDQFINASNGSVVVAQMNYRVGALGFLAGQEVQSEGALNAGLLDQRKALQWVRKYISQFGGDPDHVVMVGGSAGAGSVGLHLTAYGGRNDSLFVGAVGDAFFYPTVNNATFSQHQFDTLATTVGCGSASDKLACLRSVDINAIQQGDINGAYPNQTLDSQYIWTPVVDGNFIQDLPLRMIQNGQFVKVPLIVGDVTDEGTLFANNALDAQEVSKFMSANFPLLSSDNLTTINKLYPPTTLFPFHNLYFSSSAAAYGESSFKCPGYLIGTSMAAAGLASSVWQYNFNQTIPAIATAGFGVMHQSDLGALFGGSVGSSTGFFDLADNVENAVLFESYNAGNKMSSTIAMDYLISFVRSLDPNTFKASAAPRWNAAFASHSAEQMRIQDIGTQMEQISTDFIARCAFWTDLLSQIGQ
ncbi:triacylglycerol lipase-like protein [Aureobasidium namibiae CBS 147.97]|uniref:Triacylglycerol lipase-like protein n=1 Tax=Aureobasidium namibiae CBS 147.97 TaxID=1043004 RepID=A0A074W4L5_9PEZI